LAAVHNEDTGEIIRAGWYLLKSVAEKRHLVNVHCSTGKEDV
jgi:hypothetical protein